MWGTGAGVISDGVIVLRPLNAEDAADHLAGEDAELVRWLNGGAGTEESVRRHIEHVDQMWHNGGPIFTFAVRRLALEFLRPEATVRSALIRADPGNVSSAAVAVRAGFKLAKPAAETGDGHDWYEFVLR